MKTTIYFMRHGHVHNPKQIIYGRLPRFRISDEGRDSVKKQIETFKKLKPDIIYTSPLLRTRQTAKIIADALGKTPVISRLLIEVYLCNEGIPMQEFRKIQPYIYNEKFLRLGQESAESIKDRMLKFIDEVRKKHTGKRILAVTHGDPIVITMASVNNTPFTWQYKRDNYIKTGSFITIECDENECTVK